MTTYFTSDLHLGHRLVAGLRGFWDEDNVTLADPSDPDSARAHPDTASHDKAIADYWDATVTKQDTVIILGDLAVSGYAYALDFIEARPGRKALIAGNHDTVHPLHRRGYNESKKWLRAFEWVGPFERRKTANISYLLSHFPYTGEGDRPGPDRYTQYRLRDEGMPLLHGHTHGTEREHGHQLHVGWDAWHSFVGTDYVAAWLRGLPSA